MDFTSLSAHTGKDLTAIHETACWRVTFHNFSHIEMNGPVYCFFLSKLISKLYRIKLQRLSSIFYKFFCMIILYIFIQFIDQYKPDHERQTILIL